MKRIGIQNKKNILSPGTHILYSFTLCCLLLGIFPAFAQGDNQLVALSKQIIETKSNEGLYAPFEELRDIYFKDNKYKEFAEFLKSLGQKKKELEPFVNYYTALAFYSQLKYLEEKQGWDEYFSQGNAYRDELATDAEKTVEATQAGDPLHIYARLLIWQFHRDQQDSLSEDALTGLMSSVKEYAKLSADPKPIKEVADKFLAYGEKAKSRELYKIYAGKIAASDIKDEALNNIAFGFYKQGNLELAETIYDIYMSRITRSLSKEEAVPLLIDIARLFSYKDEGAHDASYAEKVFQEIENLGGKESFNQEFIYLRAFNLEKAKEYAKAKDNYLDLVRRYPGTGYNDEAVFKSAIITTYVLRDIKQGKGYFQGLAEKETMSPQKIPSLYQLGLLSQWEGDLIKAKEYYNRLIAEAGENSGQTLDLTRERLKEIDEGRPIEYNLKTFLDLSLKEENAIFDMTKFDLSSHPYHAKKNGDVTVSSSSYFAQAGCMQVELQYLWSGDTGTKKPSLAEAQFNTTYTESGTKEINLVIVSPAGIVDRSIDIVDIE
jgi:hypothetical protein